MVVKTKKLEGSAVVEMGDSRYFFDTITDHSISIQNQITDNYIENNTAIQDHIAHNPIIVTVKGISGEVVYKPPMKALTELDKWLYNKVGYNAHNILTNKLTIIPALLPPVDNITQAAKDTVQYVEASYERYKKIYDNFTRKGLRPIRLKTVYNRLIEANSGNKLLTVYTPFTAFENMAIQSISLSQGNINYAADIEITFKQIQFAETKTTDPDKNMMSQYNAYARAEEVNHGKAQGVENSLLYSLFHPQ